MPTKRTVSKGPTGDGEWSESITKLYLERVEQVAAWDSMPTAFIECFTRVAGRADTPPKVVAAVKKLASGFEPDPTDEHISIKKK